MKLAQEVPSPIDGVKIYMLTPEPEEADRRVRVGAEVAADGRRRVWAFHVMPEADPIKVCLPFMREFAA